MQIFRAELHVHTVLSPCAEVEMIPPLIVEEAAARGINLIAITDHNASANVRAVQKAAAEIDLTVLPGMEVQTREEVHILCLFDTLDQLSAWQTQVDAALPNLKNDPEHFGEQFIVDETGDFLCRDDRLLLTSTSFSVEEVFESINQIGGLAIPAHIDRRTFGFFANLGFIPPDLPVEAVEISRHLTPASAIVAFPQLVNYPIIKGGDVHRLEEFLGVNEFHIAAPTIAEIRAAIHRLEDRFVTVQY